MNFQNLNFDYVEPPHHFSRPHRLSTPPTASDESQATVRPILDNRRIAQDYASSQGATFSDPPTVIPYAPSPPSPAGSDTDSYGPDRLFGPPPVILSNHAFARLRYEPDLTLDELQTAALQTMMADQNVFSPTFKDHLALAASSVTPGVDDGPYLQYALEALTRDRDTGFSYTSTDDEPNPLHRMIPDQGLNYYQPQTFEPLLSTTQLARDAEPEQRQFSSPLMPEMLEKPRKPLAAFDPNSRTSSLSTLVVQPKQPPQPIAEWAKLEAKLPRNAWQLQDHDRFSRNERMNYPRPDFKPPILRPISLFTLMTLCILMITALLFSAIFSQLRRSLVNYNESIYGGQYFLFRILPQILAATIHIYAQAIITTIFRILPFVRMEGNSHPIPEQRSGALFEDLYPKSYLWPQLIGTWHIRVPCLVVWLMNFAIPLQSCLFTVIRVEDDWRWATVQGIAWTLVVLYVALLVSVAMLYLYWRNRATGLIWDPRSIADIVALVTNSNVLADYRGTELLATRDELKTALSRRHLDKLGYWTWNDHRRDEKWHGIATDLRDEAWLDRNMDMLGVRQGEKTGEKQPFGVDVEASRHTAQVRYRYLPWCMRSNQMLYFIVTAFVLLVALLVVSFLPSTNIRHGFLPWVPAAPVPGAFSAADFLYSFLPALLGQIMFLLFQSLELSLRILQPWGELQKHTRSPTGGALPELSILADYTACLPFQVSLRALRNRHWRLAILSLLSTLFILIPALAGGVFMALTLRTGEVRMLPNIPLYAVLLALLVLYVFALVAMLPGRRYFRLPHAVTCIAEVVSFCANEDLTTDETFKDVLYKTQLRGKVGVDRAPAAKPRWVFRPGMGRDQRLGIRRVKRYTELEKNESRRQRRNRQQAMMI